MTLKRRGARKADTVDRSKRPMKKLVMLVCAIAFAQPAAACVPPPGLSLQQWYGICGRDMEDGFARGFGGRQSHDAFMASMYRMYQSSQPTFNPRLRQQQNDLAINMASGHQQFMNAFNQSGENRTAAFNNSMRAKAWQQNNTMMYIQDEHCAIWDSAHTFCLKVPN